MCTVSLVKIATGWLCQIIVCIIGGPSMKVQCSSPWKTPTCIVIMTNATRNVAVGFPAILRLPVTIVTMSISFLIWPQVGGSLSCISLSAGCLLDHPLVGGGISLSYSLSWGESSTLSLLIFGTSGSMELDKPWWYPHWVFCTFRKNTSMPSIPHRQTMSNGMLSGRTSMCGGIDIRWNCLHRAEAFWWKHDLIRKLLWVWQFVWETQSLGYLPGHYHEQVGQGD
jgi:hypothetical protein